MDRRHFLLGASALGLTACAHPERELLDEFGAVPLEPGDRRTTTTTTQPPADPADDAGVEEVVEVTPADADGSPFDIPEEDRPGLAFVAQTIGASIAVTATAESTEPVFTFDNPIPSGGPLVFLVEQFRGLDRLEVLLPTRPNGSFGWINGAEVALSRHNYAIQVRLDDFLLTVTDRERTIFETTVGVARENAPTPRGRYYTTELLRPPTPDTVYGAFAYGLSGYSDTFITFAGGDGQLGIHGTNEPDTLGTNVSAGCIRMHNDDIDQLVNGLQLPVGVPVEVI